MSLSFDWAPLATLVSDLKALVGLGVAARLEAVEARPEPTPYDDAPVLGRLDALEAADAAGIDAATMARIVALEEAVSSLSAALAAYSAPKESAPADPPVV